MAKHRAAEWLLARLTSPARAQEILGDLLEQYPAAIGLPLAKVVFALSWQRAAAVVLAMCAVLLAIGPSDDIVRPHTNAWRNCHIPAAAGVVVPDAPWAVAQLVLVIVSTWFLSLAVLSLVRYGRREPLTKAAGALSLTSVGFSCLIWLPHALPLSVLCFASLALAMLLSRTYRRVLTCVLAAGVALGLAWVLLTWLFSRLAFFFTWHAPGNGELALLWAVCVFVEALVLDRLKRWLLPASQATAELTTG